MAKKKTAVTYNTSDWSFYRSSELVKVAYDKSKPGKILVAHRSGKVEEVDEAKFMATHEPAAPGLKSANF